MTQVSIRDLTKVFEGSDEEVVAVDDVSLAVKDGEFLVLLGPSGCGKTTTLRMIGGLETPTGGTIEFDGVDVVDVKARNRDVAMVFQDFALYPHMTVRQNLGFGLEREHNDFSSAEIDARVEEVAELLEIEELLADKPAELSGGQKQRVALGRAIVREPRLFLFDEPLANLDAKLRRTMRTEIEELHAEVGVTSVYVTHNQEEAMTMADRIAIMNDGELQQVATPEQVFNAPANRFVGEFIGSPSMNFLTADVVGGEGGAGGAYELATDVATFSVPADRVPEPIEEESVVVGFRPDDLRQAGGERAIEGEISVIEPLGTDAVVHADTEAGRITAKTEEYVHLEAGQTLQLTIDPANIYLFSAADGRLLKPKQLDRDDGAEPEPAEV